MSLSIREQIHILSADIQRVARNPSPSALQELQVRVDSIQGYVSEISDMNTLVSYSESIQKLKRSDVSQLRSSVKGTTGSAPSKPPQKVYSVQDLKRTFDFLVKKAQTGTINIEHVMEFQKILLSSKSAHSADPTMNEMEVGTEVLLTVAVESSSKKGSGPQIRYSAFRLNDQQYHVNLTRGDGACAIHALLGVRQPSGVYQYNGNPRKHFTDHLKAALTGAGNAEIKELYTEAITSHFGLVNTDASSRMLFAGSAEGRAIKAQWDQLRQNGNRLIDEARALEAQLWVPLAETNHGGFMDAVMAEVNAENGQRGAASRYHGMNREQVLLMLQGNPLLLLDIIATNQDRFYGKISGHDNAETIMDVRQAQVQALRQLAGAQKQFIHSPRVVNHYIQVANHQDYYFNTGEVHIGALLFDKKVQVVASRPPEYRISPSEYLFNPGADGELIVIHHRGAHFSRCVLDAGVGAPPVRREEEGKRPESQPKSSPSPTVVSVSKHPQVPKTLDEQLGELIVLGKQLKARKDFTREEAAAFNEQLQVLKEKANPSYDKIIADLGTFGRSLERHVERREALERTAETTNTTTNSVWNLWGYWK